MLFLFFSHLALLSCSFSKTNMDQAIYEQEIVDSAENCDEMGLNPDTSIDGVDQNCDGVDGPDADQDGHVDIEAGGDDCDDQDPESMTTEEDPDCDGVPVWMDCDDQDPSSTSIDVDSDCDGFLDRPCSALAFNGVSDLLTTDAVFTAQDFSLELWIKLPPNITKKRIVLDSNEGSTGNYFSLMVTDECKIRAEIRPAGSYTRHLTDATPRCNQTWIHIVFVREDAEIRLFIEGKEVSNHSFPTGEFSFSAPLLVGYAMPEHERKHHFLGLIYAIHISNVALYETDFIPTARDPLDSTEIFWFFSEGEGDTVYSEVGEETGTIEGAEWIEDCPYEFE